MIVCQFAQLCLFLASLDRCKNITRIVKRPQKVERQLVDCRSAPFHKKTTSKFQKSDCYSFVMRQGCFFFELAAVVLTGANQGRGLCFARLGDWRRLVNIQVTHR